MKRDDKKKFRDIKRTLKKRGHKRNRQGANSALRDDPENAHEEDYSFDAYRSQPFNGMDYDSTRKKREKHREAGNAKAESERPGERPPGDETEVQQ